MKYYYEEGKYDYRYSTEKWEYLVLDLLTMFLIAFIETSLWLLQS